MNIFGRRVLYLDVLRLFATFSVIILHVAAQNWSHVALNTFEWKIFNFYDSLFTCCVALFVMISGALFLSKNVSVELMFKKYILRIAISFLFWSTIYAVFTSGDINSKIACFIKGHYHMWYLFMIVGLYMCYPLLNSIVKSGYSKYFLVLGFVFAFLLPDTLLAISDFGNNATVKIMTVLESNINNMNMFMVLGYSFYFVLGYYLYQISFDKRWQRVIIYLCGIVGVIMTVYLTYYKSVKIGEPSQNYYSDFWISTMLEAVAIFVLVRSRYENKQYHGKIIRKLSKYSFGAYLVHAFVIEGLNHYDINTLLFNPIVSVPGIAVIVCIISFGISGILNNIPLLNKYVV